jgi:pyruvate formate lyase activating enzyme
LKEAMFYEKLEKKLVKCKLCPHECFIRNNERGICGVRENKDGILYSLVYGKAIAKAIDPVEKKPLFHFYPGSSVYSFATIGCNFRCLNCQNYDISQFPKGNQLIIGEEALPEQIVKEAKQYGCKSIAYTYTEPTIFFEYAYDTAKLASKNGIKNIFVTNGYINDEPLIKISPYIHAANIDLKSISNDFYQKVCGARLDPVLKAIKLYKKLGIWIEITTLIIPTFNDKEKELASIAKFIKGIDDRIPWHVTRFYPAYKLTDLALTPIETLRKARKIGLEVGLKYVYIGNIPGEAGENTYCYSCGKLLITRSNFELIENLIKNSKCPYCDARIEGVWE